MTQARKVHTNTTMASVEVQEFNWTYSVEVAACTQAGSGMVSPQVLLFVPENSKPLCRLSPHLIMWDCYNWGKMTQPSYCSKLNYSFVNTDKTHQSHRVRPDSETLPWKNMFVFHWELISSTSTEPYANTVILNVIESLRLFPSAPNTA